jgi:SAM-dependent methyltransferase
VKHTNIAFVQWDFLDLEYPDNHFDIAILNMGTIGNFDDKESVIKEISRMAPKFFFWFREPVEKDVPIRLQMYKEEGGEFRADWTTIKEITYWLESNCTTRESVKEIAKKIWVHVKFHKIFLSYTMAEIIRM